MCPCKQVQGPWKTQCNTELVQRGKKCGEDTGIWAREVIMQEYVVICICVCVMQSG